MLKYKELHFGEWIINRWWRVYVRNIFPGFIYDSKNMLKYLFYMALFPIRIFIQIEHLFIEFISRLYITFIAEGTTK